MDVSEAVKDRRSIRQYSEEDVSEEHINNILDAGRWAPSGLNNQPWRFKVLRGDVRDKVAEHTKYGHIMKKAPVCIAVFLDRDLVYDRTKDVQSVGACIQNMLLRIHSLGLGGVWLGEILNQREAVEKELNTKHELMAVIAVGHPKGEGKSSRKGLDELML